MKRLRFNFRSKKAVLATVAAVVALGLGGFAFKEVSATEIRDCSGNSIIQCGALSPSEFINKVKQNNTNGHHDLPAIYANFGLVPKQYQQFVKYAKMGQDYRNGNVVVNGQVVATNAWSIGRWASWQGSGYFTKKINGVNYYGNYNDKAYGSNVNSIPVMVLFNSHGVMQFAAMTACGNPVGGKKVTPKYSCDLLQTKHDSGNTYSFSTKASASENAKVVKVVYDFGDGSSKVTETSLSKEVTHTYTKPGSFTTSVTVYVSLPGNQTVTVTSAHCQTKITVTPPPPPVSLTCNDLTLTPGVVNQQNGDQSYTLTANGSAKNATITGYAFTLGDGSAPVKVSTGNTSASTTHTYAPGTYLASVVVSAKANGKGYTATSVNCEKRFTVNKFVPGSLACDNLTLTAGNVDSTTGDTQYTLAATASEQNATIDHYTFTLGDGSSDVTVNGSSTSASTTHTYVPGTYDVHVSVTGTVNGKQVTETSPNCAGSITVKPPVPSPTPTYSCDGLTVTPGDINSTTGATAYTLAATASVSNATITNYVFNFDDNNQTQTVTTSNTSATATHTYAPGTYNPTVAVTVTLSDGTTKQVTSAACATKLTIAPPTCTAPNGQTYPVGSSECQPQPPTCTAPNGQTYPAGSSQCTPTCTSPTNGQQYPMGSAQCQTPPPVLPNTGAGNTIALFAGVSLAAAGLHWLFVSRRFGRSSL